MLSFTSGTQNTLWNWTSTACTGANYSQWINHANSVTYSITGKTCVIVPGPNIAVSQTQGIAPTGFNALLNASDLLAEFARYAQKFGMSREAFLDLPLRLFIQWLCIEAALLDKVEVPPEVDPVVKIPHRHRCRACGKFLPNVFRRAGVMHCSPAHMERTLLALG